MNIGADTTRICDRRTIFTAPISSTNNNPGIEYKENEFRKCYEAKNHGMDFGADDADRSSVRLRCGDS